MKGIRIFLPCLIFTFISGCAGLAAIASDPAVISATIPIVNELIATHLGGGGGLPRGTVALGAAVLNALGSAVKA